MKTTSSADSVKGKVEVLSANRIFMVVMTILFLAFQFGGTISAQDLLILKTGKELKVNIVEENTELIKYREYEDPKGPLYSITRDKIAEIKYGKGSKNVQVTTVADPVKTDPADSVNRNALPFLTVEKRYIFMDGQRQTPRNVRTLMEDYPDALDAYETGRKMCNISNYCAYGVILTGLVTTSVASGKDDEDEAQKVRYVGLAIDGAFIITAIVMATKGKQNIRKSATVYNGHADNPVGYKLNVGFQQYGFGLAMKF